MFEIDLKQKVTEYAWYLVEQERSELTKEKYLRDVRAFVAFLGERPLNREQVLEYKAQLVATYKASSVNSILAALNGFFSFLDRGELRMKPLKILRSIFAPPEKELTKEEYKRLLQAATQQKNQRINLVMQTICSTGIRVSEIRFITVEAVRSGRVEVVGKGKRRIVFLTQKLRALLLNYIKQEQISDGCIFLSNCGEPLSRHKIWSDMKALCITAGIEPKKVFPHNLRHLFARTFYAIEKDLLRLADILGHSNINTTRIYTAESGDVHAQILERLTLVYL